MFLQLSDIVMWRRDERQLSGLRRPSWRELGHVSYCHCPFVTGECHDVSGLRVVVFTCPTRVPMLWCLFYICPAGRLQRKTMRTDTFVNRFVWIELYIHGVIVKTLIEKNRSVCAPIRVYSSIKTSFVFSVVLVFLLLSDTHTGTYTHSVF